jgi:hypothetical protein
MVPGQPEIAKVNRKTGVLYLNRRIWEGLPSDQKEFVLHHENGHLQLRTNDEFKANAYAVSKFSPAGTFNNAELGKRIIVMKEILSKADDNSSFTADAIAGAVSGIFSNLSVLGIGSKSRQKEAAATAAANVQILGAQSELEAAKAKTRTKVLVISGVMILVLVVTVLILRKK